jgi:hypothetical protein
MVPPGLPPLPVGEAAEATCRKPAEAMTVQKSAAPSSASTRWVSTRSTRSAKQQDKYFFGLCPHVATLPKATSKELFVTVAGVPGQ